MCVSLEGKSPKRGTTHACSAPSHKTLGGDPTPAAVGTSSSKRWQATFTRSGLSHRYSVRAAQRDSLGDAAAGTGLRLRHDLLAKATRLATVGHLATDPLRFAGFAGTLRKYRLVPSNSRLQFAAGSFWGQQTGPIPTDRAKLGSKRHLICDGHGIPLAIQLTGANRDDSQQRSRWLMPYRHCKESDDVLGVVLNMC